MINKLEKDIQREILEYLDLRGDLFFWRSNNVPVFGTSKDGKKRFRSMPKFSMKGVPDITLVSEGRFVGLEVKREGCDLYPDQIIFKEKLENRGGRYFVVRSVDDVKNALINLLEENLS